MKPPAPPSGDAVISLHGEEVPDPYAWMRAENWREVIRDPDRLDAAIRGHLEAENAYADHVLADCAELRERLFREMKGRIREDDSTPPRPDGPHAYFTRYREGGQHPIFCRVPRDGGDEEILLDGDREAEGKAFFQIARAAHAPDHARLAWAADEAGGELFTIRVRDLESGEDMPGEIRDAAPGFAWAGDGRTLFFVRLDENHRPSSVWRATPGEPETLVYEEPDPGLFVWVGLTSSRRFVVISIFDHDTSECRLVPADDPTAAPRVVAPRETGVEYDVEERDGTLFIRTNAGDAEDFRIVTAPVDAPGRENWTELVAHESGRLILSVELFADWLVRMERVGGLPRAVVRRLDDGEEHVVAFDEEAYALHAEAGAEFASSTLRLFYSSMATPPRIYDYDMRVRARALLKEQEIPSGHDPADYVTRRIEATAPDGETVPVTLLHRAGLERDGSAPCLLYGYGSYGISLPAAFNPSRLSLVDRGFVWAQAHVRGGMEKGRRWYLDGRLEKKTNTFTDFIAAAETLIGEGYCRAGRIAIEGASAGGLLVGAVTNMRPDLWGAAVANVPLVDMLATICDESLPLTPIEWPEWGDPIRDPEVFRRMRGYSPINNLQARDYPPVLALGGLTDPRVCYWEPAKWVARLRAVRTDANPTLLRTEMDAGHFGAAGRFDRLKEVAEIQAFVIRCLLGEAGLAEEGGRASGP